MRSLIITLLTLLALATPTSAAGAAEFNPNVTLTFDQIDDLRPPTLTVDYPVILPDDTTTVTVCILVQTPTYTFAYVPEESPEGGHFDGWRDNSPLYTDGWMLQVNDSTHRTLWVAPTHDPSKSDIELGA